MSATLVVAGDRSVLGDPPGLSDPTEPAAAIVLVATATPRPGRLRVEALVSSADIRRVDFLLDGELVARDRRFPFGAVVESGNQESAGHLEAVALDHQGMELARDTLLLRPEDTAMAVSLSGIRQLGDGGWLEVAVDVTHPEGVAIERVDFYRDERYVASVSASPYRTRIASAEGGGFLRAVALTSNGRWAEGVHLLDQAGAGDTLSVGLVELYAMVTTRSGSPVVGLAPESFELLHEGRPRSIERFSEGDAVPLSLALVIDSSGSMYESMDRAKQSARRFLESALDEGDEALLVDFDIRPRLLQASTSDLQTLVSRFDQIRSRGGSAVYDAISFGSLQLERSVGRKAMVVLTDGQDSGSRISPARCAELARRAGVPVFVLSLGHPEDVPSHRRLILRGLAEATGGSVHEIHRPSDIAAAYRAIDLQLRGQYLLGFSTDIPLSAAELESLAVRVGDRRLRVRTILGGQVRIAN